MVVAKDKKRNSDLKKKEDSFGGCTYEKISPARDKMSPTKKILNIKITFEEALKLNLALDECIRQLNSYDRRPAKAKKAAVNLTVHLDKNRIAVVERNL